MSINIKINVDIGKIVEKKISKTFKEYAHTRLWAFCDEYVPYRDGMLSSNVSITEDALTYKVPYAKKQYFGDNFNFNRKDQHEKATSRWDEAMMVAKGDRYRKDLQNALKAGDRFMEAQNSKTWNEIDMRYQEALRKINDNK